MSLFSKKGLGLLCASVVLTGCMSSNTTLSILSIPIALSGQRERDYMQGAGVGYTYTKNDTIAASMIIYEEEEMWTPQAIESFLEQSTQAGYKHTKIKTITNKCGYTYTYALAEFASGPITEQATYLAMVFHNADVPLTISYVSPSKKSRSTWISDRKNTYGCIDA